MHHELEQQHKRSEPSQQQDYVTAPTPCCISVSGGSHKGKLGRYKSCLCTEVGDAKFQEPSQAAYFDTSTFVESENANKLMHWT